MDKYVLLRNVYKYVLKDLSLSIDDIGPYILVGPNGSGKTTILRLIAGVTYPSRGRVEVLGRDPFTDPEVKSLIVYSAQHNLADQYDTVEKILRLYRNITPKSYRGSIEEASKALGLNSIMKRKIYELSGGQLKKLELAKIMLRKAIINLIDEPTENLDLATRNKITEVIKDRSSRSVVIVSTHNIDLIETLKGEILIVNNGRLLGRCGYEKFIDALEKYESYNIEAYIDLDGGVKPLEKIREEYIGKYLEFRYDVAIDKVLERMGIKANLKDAKVTVIKDAANLPQSFNGKVAIYAGSIPARVYIKVRDVDSMLKILKDLYGAGSIKDISIKRMLDHNIFAGNVRC